MLTIDGQLIGIARLQFLPSSRPDIIQICALSYISQYKHDPVCDCVHHRVGDIVMRIHKESFLDEEFIQFEVFVKPSISR